MYDYKFRQGDLSFKKPKRRWHKALLPLAGLGLAAGTLYGIAQVGLTWKIDLEGPDEDSDIIPLSLPPHAEPEEGTRPSSTDPDPPTEIPNERAFTEARQALEEGRRSRSSSSSLQYFDSREVTLIKALDLVTAATSTDKSGSAVAAGEEPVDDETGTWIEHEVRPGDSLTKIFRENDLSPRLLQSILNCGAATKHLRTIRPADKLRIHLDGKRRFTELQLKLDALRSVSYKMTDSGIEGTEVRKETEAMATAATGVIERRLFSSAMKAGLPNPVIMQLTRIFGYDIDFALEIRPGDRFTVIFEELWADGEQVGSGDILAAGFVNQGRAHQAVRFETGPHLHYEFRVNGVHRNPLGIKAPMANPLPRKVMKEFEKIARPLLASLEQTANDTIVAAARWA